MIAKGQVSYVVASYNHERFVGETIQSILNQSEPPLELILVDDGSTDGTVRAAAALAKRDSRLRIVTQENRGVVAARNRGVELSTGEFVSIVDSDDLLPIDRNAFLATALREHPAAPMAYGDAWIIDAGGTRLGRFFENYAPIEGDFSTELFANYCFVPAVSVMFRKAAWEKTGGFWGPGPTTDYLKWIELGLLGEVLCLRDRQLGSWRWHGANVTMARAVDRVKDYATMQEGLEELIRRNPEFGDRLGDRRLRRRYGRCHFMGAFYAAMEGAWPTARLHFSKAITFDASLLNVSAWLSTFPPLNVISPPLYRWAARRHLKVRYPSM